MILSAHINYAARTMEDSSSYKRMQLRATLQIKYVLWYCQKQKASFKVNMWEVLQLTCCMMFFQTKAKIDRQIAFQSYIYVYTSSQLINAMSLSKKLSVFALKQPPFKYKDRLSRHRYSRPKNRAVMRPSFLYNWNFHTNKAASLNKNCDDPPPHPHPHPHP